MRKMLVELSFAREGRGTRDGVRNQKGSPKPLLHDSFMPSFSFDNNRTAPARKFAWVFAVAVFLFSSALLRAEERPRVEVWLIDTHCAPVSGDFEQGKSRIAFWRLDQNQQWSAATAESFAERGEKSTPNVFLLHGNGTDRDGAIQFAWPIYCSLYKQAGKQPYRVVIWSWPAERVCRKLRADVQTKASYCDSQSYYLADSLRNMKPETPVSLIGYSFGARIITGSLHLLGGGTLAGCRQTPASSEESTKPKRPIRAVLVAAAVDCQALSSGQEHDCAAVQADAILITRNGCDRALRLYSRLYGRGGPEALGYVGPCCGCCGENIRLLDASCSVGKSHHWDDYLYCSGMFELLPHYLFADSK
jgi:hypothetical protein